MNVLRRDDSAQRIAHSSEAYSFRLRYNRYLLMTYESNAIDSFFSDTHTHTKCGPGLKMCHLEKRKKNLDYLRNHSTGFDRVFTKMITLSGHLNVVTYELENKINVKMITLSGHLSVVTYELENKINVKIYTNFIFLKREY